MGRDQESVPVLEALARYRRRQLETAVTPRDAFFAPAERVRAEQAAGRVAAEMLSPYPPGVPADRTG